MDELIPLFACELTKDGNVLVERTVALFNEAQDVMRLDYRGVASLPTVKGHIDCAKFYNSTLPATPSMTVTELPLSDNWYSHTRYQRSLITIADWRVNFLYDRGPTPISAPEASLLASFALSSLLIISALNDEQVLHYETVGCLFDLCVHKPERAQKLRAAYICQACTAILSGLGLSSVQLDATRSILECARSLALGRPPQSSRPLIGASDDAKFVHNSQLPVGLTLPPRLFEAYREDRLTILVGSGMSLQEDVKVRYPKALDWERLPTWAEVPSRLADCVKRYLGREVTPRSAVSLSEFLADLDYYRSVLGEHLYYPRAILDIFSPRILQPGRANRLICSMKVPWVLSTNYDFVLQYSAPAGTPVFTWKEAIQAREYLAANRGLSPLLKLHGCASRPDTIVLSHTEYIGMRQSQAYLSLLQSVFESNAILFIGFGLTDPFDLDVALSESSIAGAAAGEKFAFLPRERCQEAHGRFNSLQTIPYDEHSQISYLLAALIRSYPH